MIKGWYLEPDNRRRRSGGALYTVAYGWIKHIFLHAIHPDSKPKIMVELDWLNIDLSKSFGGLRRGHKEVWKRNLVPPNFMFLKEYTPSNITLLPEDPMDEDCSIFKAIDREGKLGIL